MFLAAFSLLLYPLSPILRYMEHLVVALDQHLQERSTLGAARARLVRLSTVSRCSAVGTTGAKWSA